MIVGVLKITIGGSKMVRLGDRVKDRITGFSGIVVARTEWLFGCVRLSIQPEKLTKDGKSQDSMCVDEPQCKILKRAAVQNKVNG